MLFMRLPCTSENYRPVGRVLIPTDMLDYGVFSSYFALHNKLRAHMLRMRTPNFARAVKNASVFKYSRASYIKKPFEMAVSAENS